MKKIFISLLMVAATLSAFAQTYTGKAKLTLKSSDNKSCSITIAESADFVDGLNPSYYAELNEEGKAILFYVEFGGKKYAHFASSPATMQDLQLGVKTNASTTYSMTASNVTGSLRIKFAGVEYTINANGAVFTDVALAASSVLPAAGDEANYVVNPSAPAGPSICFRNNILEVEGYAGKSLVVKNGATEIVNEPSLPASYSKDLTTITPALPEKTRLVVTLDGTDYQIDYKPKADPVNP